VKILLISGRAKAGKDSAAAIILKYLKDKHSECDDGNGLNPELGEAWAERSARVRAFAEPLKKMVCILLGITMEQMRDPKVKEECRPWLVNLGGDVRERDPAAWAESAGRELFDFALGGGRYFIIPDWRYFNEAWYLIKELARVKNFVPGGPRPSVHLLRVSASREVRMARMGEDNYRRYVESGIANDSSEKQLDVIETADFKIDPSQLDDVNTLRRVTRVVENNEGIAMFTMRVLDWFNELDAPPQYADPRSPSAADVSKACYRLARRMGPEARLMVAEDPS
jgi:hypothetical protein